MAYSLDLRKRVVSYIESGGDSISASEVFSIGERTVRRWITLKKETGNLKPRPHGGGQVYKVQPSVLEAYVLINPDNTLAELANKFGASSSAIRRSLKSVNYVSKKNITLRGKKRRKT